MKIRLANELQTDSIVDGEGIRTVIWAQGCPHHCKGCHNPHTFNYKGGFEVDVKDVIKEISTIQMQDGITFSGGDPMVQAKACAKIAKATKELGLSVWAYTGYTFEELIEKSILDPSIMEFLKHIDVLIDGRFVLEEKSLDIYYRGSRNQRIIDVQKTLKKGNKIVLIDKYMKDKPVRKFKYENLYQANGVYV